MFVQNFTKLSAVIHELSCKQRNRDDDDGEVNAAFVSTGVIRG